MNIITVNARENCGAIKFNTWEMGIDLIAARIIKCSHCTAKHKFYRAFDVVSGKVGRSVSEEVMIQLLKTKCFPVLYYGLEVCPVTIETRLDRWTMPSTGALDKLFSTRDQSVVEEPMMFSECHPVHYTTIGRKRKRKIFTKNFECHQISCVC